MGRYIETIESTIDLATAFNYVLDFSNVPDWDPGVTSSRQVSGASPGLGSKYEVVAPFAGRDVTLIYEVTEVIGNERIVIEGNSNRSWAKDVITFSSDPVKTWIVYEANLGLKGPLKIVEVLFSGTFAKLVKKAGEGLQAKLNSLPV